jgi:hypothetical protein
MSVTTLVSLNLAHFLQVEDDNDSETFDVGRLIISV